MAVGLRSSLVLLLLLALVGGLLLVTGGEDGGGGGEQESVWPADFDLARVEELEIINMYRGIYEETRFHFAGDTWRMVFPRRDLAAAARIRQILFSLEKSEYRLLGPAAELAPRVLREAGLRDDRGGASGRARIRLRAGEKEALVWVGEEGANRELLFVQIGGKVYRVGLALWTSLNHRVDEFRSRRVFRLHPRAVQQVRLERSFDARGEPTQVLEFTRKNREEWLLREGETESRADRRSLQGLLVTLTGLRVRSFVGELPADLSLALLDPPFFRVRLTGGGREEELAIGRATEEGLLCRVTGRPYLLSLSCTSRDPLWSFLRGRGIRYFYLDSSMYRDLSVDYRFRRPLDLAEQEVERVRVRRGEELLYEIEKERRGGGWICLRPLSRALREGAAPALIRRLVNLEAVSTYRAALKPPATTGLDRPFYTLELAGTGRGEPLQVKVGRQGEGGYYLAVSDKPGQVFFLTSPARAELVPGLLELVTLRVHKVRPEQAQIILLEGRGQVRRWDRDPRNGLYLPAQGGEVEEELLDLMDRILDLSASSVVSLEAEALEREREALVIRIHRDPIDPTAPGVGPLAARLILVRKGERVLLSSSRSAPLVFTVPPALWRLAESLAGRK